MGFDWHALVGWVVILMSGLVPSWCHKFADRYPNNWLSKFLSAHDPRPALIPVVDGPVTFTSDQLRQITEAMKEGITPLANELLSVKTELHALKNSIRDGLTFTATTTIVPTIDVDPG
jgi:hypothetical protein